MIKMYSKFENEENYKNKEMLRMLLPAAKMFSARCSEEVCLEGIQGFGASGYMENSFIPHIFRDTIVTSIWEGSINLLSFDFMKVIKGSLSAYQKLLEKIQRRIKLM
jgi:alkylation response protein AidB-like acyl-CoA dehydrogenase